MAALLREWESLSLQESYMDFPDTLEERKPIVRDILASFVRGPFASEYRSDIYDKIDEYQSQPDDIPVIHDDFVGTMMQAGCFDRQAWAVLNKCHPPDVRARIFLDKLQQRFDEGFQRYQSLTTVQRHEEGPSQLAQTVQSTVADIAGFFRQTAETARQDLQQRKEGRAGTLLYLLKVLAKVGQHHRDIAAVSRSSLFHHLILAPPATDRGFLLDAFEILLDDSITISSAELRNIQEQLQAIPKRLPNQVPVAYRNRLAELSAAIDARIVRAAH